MSLPDESPRIEATWETLSASELTSSSNPALRALGSSHQKLQLEQLVKLAHDENPLVRAAAAGNPKLPADEMRRLALDEDSMVREDLLANPSISVECLILLACDSDPLIWSAAVETPRFEERVRAYVADIWGEKVVRELPLQVVVTMGRGLV